MLAATNRDHTNLRPGLVRLEHRKLDARYVVCPSPAPHGRWPWSVQHLSVEPSPRRVTAMEAAPAAAAAARDAHAYATATVNIPHVAEGGIIHAVEACRVVLWV